MSRNDSELRRFNAAVEERMKDAYWQWIDAHWPNEKPRIVALWDERATLQARMTEIDKELLKFVPEVMDARIDIEKRTVEPFLAQFAVERRKGDEG